MEEELRRKEFESEGFGDLMATDSYPGGAGTFAAIGA